MFHSRELFRSLRRGADVLEVSSGRISKHDLPNPDPLWTSHLGRYHGTDASLMDLSSMVDGYVGRPGRETKNGYVRRYKVLLVYAGQGCPLLRL